MLAYLVVDGPYVGHGQVINESRGSWFTHWQPTFVLWWEAPMFLGHSSDVQDQDQDFENRLSTVKTSGDQESSLENHNCTTLSVVCKLHLWSRVGRVCGYETCCCLTDTGNSAACANWRPGGGRDGDIFDSDSEHNEQAATSQPDSERRETTCLHTPAAAAAAATVQGCCQWQRVIQGPGASQLRRILTSKYLLKNLI